MSSETGESMNSQYFSKNKALVSNHLTYFLQTAVFDLHRFLYPSILSCTALLAEDNYLLCRVW